MGLLQRLQKLFPFGSKTKNPIRSFRFGESPKQESDVGADQDTYMSIFRNEPFVRGPIGAIVDASVKEGWQWVPRFPDLDPNKIQPRIKTVRRFFDNPEVEFPVFLRNLITNVVLLDDGYIEVVLPDSKEITQGTNGKGFFMLDSGMMKVKRDENQRVLGFVHNEGTKFETPFKPEEIVHVAMNKVGSAFYGMSDIETMVRSASLYSAGKTYNERLFENSGVPTLAITVNGASDEQLDRLEETMKNVRSGDNLVLGGDITVVPISGLHKDLEYNELLNTTKRELMVVMRVPDIAVGVGTKGSQEAARQSIQTFGFRINGVQQIIENAIDRLMLRLFGENYIDVRFEMNEWVDPFVQAQIDAIYLKWAVYTPNDVRSRMKMRLAPWGEEPWVPVTSRPETTGDDGQRRDGSRTEEQAERENRQDEISGDPAGTK